MTTIAVIGAGYVGLVTGACLAHKGNQIIVVENNKQKIQALLEGKIPFYEPGLETLVADGIKQKTLQFVSSIKEVLHHKPEIIFSCVGTPSEDDGSADLSYVWKVAEEIGENLENYALIINKSTVPVGTAAQVKAIISEHLTKRNVTISFDVASNPEFLKEGDALSDFLKPDRVVVGVENETARQKLYDLYKPFLTSDDQFLSMNIPSAELTKYASNAMLATRISFMNQLALLADLIGADISQIKAGMAKDRRIGKYFLNAGIGYGGSCFPKDVKALVHTGKSVGFPMTLIQEVDNVNYLQRVWFINKIFTHYGADLENKTVGIWGLSFKPETDDIRCAPSLDLINELLERGAKIIAYDPVASNNIAEIYGDHISLTQNADDVVSSADFLVILTEWKEFLLFQPEQFTLLHDKLIFDGRNCFDPSEMIAAGITYISIGRNSIGKNARQEIMIEKRKEIQTSV